MPDDWPNVASYKIWLTGDHTKLLDSSCRDSIRDWCNKNCQGCYFVGINFITFELEEDFVLASLYYI